MSFRFMRDKDARDYDDRFDMSYSRRRKTERYDEDEPYNYKRYDRYPEDYSERNQDRIRRPREERYDIPEEYSHHRRHSRRSKGYDEDYEDDYEDDYNCGTMPQLRLSKQTTNKWLDHLINADGSKGAHFQLEPILHACNDMGITFDHFSQQTLFMTVNMLYSDYCGVLRGYIPTDKELYIYVGLAKAFLEDPDSELCGEEKLAAYYYGIVKGCFLE